MGDIQPSFDSNRQILGKIYPLDTPFNVIIDVSEACNFQCNYCFRADEDKSHWGYAEDKRIMQWDLFTKVVEQLKEFPQEVKQISLSNHGEPLTNRKLPDMVRYIKKSGIKSRISIHTNASLLDEKYVYDLVDSNIERIVVSLQGLDAETYYETCGVKIDYEKFYHNLMLLYNIKKNTQLDIKIANVALKKGEKDKFYEMFQPISDRVFIEQIVPIWENVDIQNIPKTIQNKYGEEFPLQQCCPLIFHTVVVTPNGDVYPCTQLLTPHKLGNVNEKSIVAYWNSPERLALLIQQVKLERDKVCKDCYILQNSIYAKEDMIDDYRHEIFHRLKEKD